MQNKIFHNNRILELRHRVIMQKRQELRHMHLVDYVKQLPIKASPVTKELLGQKVHFILNGSLQNHTYVLGTSLDGLIIHVHPVVLKNLELEELEALVAHELGHLHYDHTNWEGDKNCDLEADEYAVTLVGLEVMHKTLLKVRNFLGEFKFLEMRLDRLTKLAEELQNQRDMAS